MGVGSWGRPGEMPRYPRERRSHFRNATQRFGLITGVVSDTGRYRQTPIKLPKLGE
jgi:hypothetical protein